ncbi:MAG: hypothetical protein ABFE16_04490 [Armatimonadia bacterium]
MFVTAHMLAGAAVGKILKRPWAAWPVAFVSHFVLDAIPHVDGGGFFGVAGGQPNAPMMALGVFDTLVGLGLVLWLLRGRPGFRLAFIAAIFATLPDLMDYVPPLNGWVHACPATSWITPVHDWFSNGLPGSRWLLGSSTQLAVAVLSILVLTRGSTSASPAPEEAQVLAHG